MNNIFLIRHGQKEEGHEYYNEQFNANDAPLTKKGIKQARLLGRRLRHYQIEHMYCSDYLRTMQTAKIINKFIKVPLNVQPEIREINLGDYENLSKEEFCQKYPDITQPYYLIEEDKPYPNGESGQNVLARILPFFQSILKLNIKNTAIITHGGIIRIFTSYILDMHIGKRFRLGNPPESCSISHVIYFQDDKRFVLNTFNDYSHLV